MPPEPDAPGVIALPPLIYVGGLVTGFALDALLDSPAAPTPVRLSLGGGLVLGGGALAASFVAALRRAGTAIDVRGETTAIVTSGPYRWSRNPGYLAMTLIYAGIAILTGRLWALLPLVAVLILIDRGVIAREERYLERKFGDEYRRYKTRTRRWL